MPTVIVARLLEIGQTRFGQADFLQERYRRAHAARLQKRFRVPLRDVRVIRDERQRAHDRRTAAHARVDSNRVIRRVTIALRVEIVAAAIRL